MLNAFGKIDNGSLPSKFSIHSKNPPNEEMDWMNLLHITDPGKGKIQVAWHCGNQLPRHYSAPVPFKDPLSAADRKELRWYLEEYLDFPYGAERNRAEKVEARMDEWGESLYAQVFASGDVENNPHPFYHEAVREGLEQCELCIASEKPEFLNIPWELLGTCVQGGEASRWNHP